MKKIIISKNKKKTIKVKLLKTSFEEVAYLFGIVLAQLCYNLYPNDIDLPSIVCMNIFKITQTEFLRLQGETK